MMKTLIEVVELDGHYELGYSLCSLSDHSQDDLMYAPDDLSSTGWSRHGHDAIKMLV